MTMPEINPKKVNTEAYVLIDVRSLEEFHGELGHVSGSKLITLGDELDNEIANYDKNQKIVFICRSGNRSGLATKQALAQGFTKVFNMTGGMILWKKLGLEVEK